ncbi:elongation factor G [Siculibacillus lacustris]|uniref:Elongation factor G n=1 Tax=Siculibacillus lacustris TaxID=1549641 RepID=A0A4Q9VRY0_9HYPH|nr:elongation factor G [Siculibacillus lacustris]TBW37672.1 elongation factor G [Siculibacillus lacustris]
MTDANGGMSSGRRGGPRCVALVGPFGSGKTTLLEALLERTGAVTRAGSVAGGTSVGDASPQARAHQMGVELNVAEGDYLGDRYTFLDCPGSVEYAFETEAVLAGVDVAVVVAEADEKKIPALQLILRLLEDRRIPHILFLNKLDKTEGGVRDVLELMQPASAVPLVLRQIPMMKDGVTVGAIDLALERAYVWQEHALSEVTEIPDAERAAEVEARYAMLERIADYDDHLMEELLSDVTPPRDEIFDDLAKEMKAGLICPVLIGSAERGAGVDRLLKTLRHESPGLPETLARLGVAPKADAVVQILKTFHTPHGGKLSVSRILAGKVVDGATLYGDDGLSDRVSGIYRMLGKENQKRSEAVAGETVALGKIEPAKTGMTLSGSKAGIKPLVVVTPPQPVMSFSISAQEHKDDAKLSLGLAKIIEEDPSLTVRQDKESGETLFAGQGEMHLRVALERLEHKFAVKVKTGPASVPYKESYSGQAAVRGRHKKQSGGHGQFGDVALEITAGTRGSGFVFADRITGGVVPRQYIPAVEEGVGEFLEKGLHGFPVVDLHVALVDGSYHTVDSSDMAFKMAAQLGMREGLAKMHSILLEPILKVSITTPSDATARINQIVSGRRGQLLGYDGRPGWPGWDIVEALIPQAEMDGLIVEIRSATQGVGGFTQSFDNLAEVVGHVAAKVLERVKAAQNAA